MSQELKKKSCSACHAYLFEEDDVVCCPVCGAPHHRECWKALGDCALHEYHGTDKQYTPYVEKQDEPETATAQETKTCPFCKESYPKDQEECPKCGMPGNMKSGIHIVSLDLLGGVPADTDLGKGVTADEARRFVLTNTQRYIPKFAKMAAGFKNSWNWLAFFFPNVWMLSRKMYKGGIILTVLTIIFSLFTMPMLSAVDTSAATTTNEMMQMIMDALPSISPSAIILAAVGSIAYLILRIVLGIIGDRLYHKYTIDTISRIKTESSDVSLDFEKAGGVNFLAMAIGYLAVSYLPSILLTLI